MDDEFENWELELAGRVVGTFLRRFPWMLREGFDDLFQECLIHWWVARRQFDASRGANRGFMWRVCMNRLHDIRRGSSRDRRRAMTFAESLDAPLEDEDGSETLVDRLNLIQLLKAPGEEARLLLRIDLAAIRRDLTSRQRSTMDLLADGVLIVDIAMRLDVHRSTVHEDVRRIRELFVDRRLDEYLN